MSYVLESIALALSVRENEYSIEWAKSVTDQALNLDTRASSTLRAFKPGPRVYPGNGEQVTELYPHDEDLPRSIVGLANDAWLYIGGLRNPSRAKQVLAVARTEYARSVFHDLLWDCGMLGTGEVTARGEVTPEHLLGELHRRNWADADAVAREPVCRWWFAASAGESFGDWCASVAHGTDRNAYSAREPAQSVSPIISADEITYGLALAWIDEAAFNPAAAPTLLAEAACAARWGGFLQGWEGYEEMVKEDQSAGIKSFAKLGADARHAEHRDMKKIAIDAYRAGTYANKDKAAEAIAGKIVPISFRTARGWLKNI